MTLVINKTLGERALEFAIKEIGQGEDPLLGNNKGEAIDRYREYLGIPASVPYGSWCPLPVVYSVAQAAGGMDKLPITFKKPQDMYRARVVWELFRDSKNAQLVYTPQAGDIGLSVRKRFGVRVGCHIYFVKEHLIARRDMLITVDGNRDRRHGKDRYALVDNFIHNQGEWRHDLVGFARLP